MTKSIAVAALNRPADWHDTILRADLLVLSEETLNSLTGCNVLDQGRKKLMERGAHALCVIRGNHGYCYMTSRQVICERDCEIPCASFPLSREETLARNVEAMVMQGIDFQTALHQSCMARETK